MNYLLLVIMHIVDPTMIDDLNNTVYAAAQELSKSSGPRTSLRMRLYDSKLVPFLCAI